MAPLRISHVVSFSSQDPKFPVENLLLQENPRPWLSCPRDRSRQLQAELQLEKASVIGYVDIGNCGCAFVQLEVGRSSWPLARPFLPLLPSVTLMSPGDSRLERNRCGVRMFKEEDFWAPAVGQKWDRLRVTCSQPFQKHGQFGIFFLRLRTSQDLQDPKQDPQDPQQDPKHPQPSPEKVEPTEGSCCSNSAFSRMFFTEPRETPQQEEEEEQLRNFLQQLEPVAQGPAQLSRPARMLLWATRRRAQQARAKAATTGDTTGPPEPGSVRDVPSPTPRLRPPRDRSPPPVTSNQTPSRRRGTRTERNQDGLGRTGNSRVRATGLCPICSGRFPTDLLPAHAATCGEDPDPVTDPISPHFISCPICSLPFGVDEVEQHASGCGDG